MKYLYNVSLLWLIIVLSGLSSLKAQVVCTYTAANDLCQNAQEISVIPLSTSTCCGNIEGVNLCNLTETGVWYFYDQSLSASQIDIENQSISGAISVEFYSGDCGNLTLISKSDCSGFESRTFEVPNCNGRVYIHISSTEDGCGEFSIAASDIVGCDFADNCLDISAAEILSPVADGAQVCVSSCMEYSCLSTCTDQSVWFRFDTDDLTTAVSLIINDAEFSPLISIYRGVSCLDLDDLMICEPVSAGEFIDLDVTPDFTYFVEISLESGDPGAFDLCINAIQEYIECSSGSISVTRMENPTADPNGPFCPGETVLFCYDLEFFVDTPAEGNGCQWLQGIVPILGGGWDMAVNNPQSQSPTNWTWFDDVDYNVDSPVLGLSTDQGGNRILEYGPGGLQSGDVLPGGWYFVSNGTNVGCTNDGHPDNMWGVNTPCGTTFNFSHCFELTARAVNDIQDCEDDYIRDLSVTLFNFADGETGCYTSLACSGDTPVRFEGQLDCSSLVDIEAVGQEICSGDYAEIPISIDGGYEIPLQVEVLSAGNTSGAQDWVFEAGSGLIPDQIINNGNNVETITYQVSFHDPETDCNTPTVTFDVLVHPEFTFDIEDLHIICEGETQLMSAPAGHDDYAWYDAETNEFLSDSRHLNTDSAGYYRIEVTEDLCTATRIVEVQVNPLLEPALDITEISVCNNYIGTLPTSIDLSQYQLNGIEGNWFDENNVLLPDASSVDFTGRNAETLQYTFETTSALVPCPNDTYNVDIIVNACECPEINIVAPADFCAVNQLFDLDNLNASTEPGTWLLTGGPSMNDIVVAGTGLEITNNTVEGRYFLTFRLDDPNLAPLCTPDSTVEFYVFQTPEAIIQDQATACNIYTGTENDFIDLDDMNLSSSSGVWTSERVEPVIDGDNLVSFAGLDPGDYRFFFDTNTAQAPCLNQQYECVVTVLDCSCPDTDLSPIDDICIDDITLSLGDYLVTAETGFWSLESGADMSSVSLSGDQFVISPLSVEGEYTVRYTLSDPDIGPLCDRFEEIEFSIYQPIDVDIAPDFDLCNEYTGTLLTTLDLDDLISTSNAGTWESVDPSVIIGAGNTIDLDGFDAGDYTFRFSTTDAQAPCLDASFETVVNLNDCRCPDVTIDALADQCIDNLLFNLDDLLVTTETGSWSLESGADLTSLSLNGSELSISEATTGGAYTLRYTLSDPDIGPLCDRFSEFEFNLYNPVDVDIDPDFNLCNVYTGTLLTSLDLDDLISTSNSGSWESIDPSVSIASGNTIDLDGYDAGDYTFRFTTDDAQAPCVDASYETVVQLEDCRCPDVSISTLPDQCISNTSFDLNNLVQTLEPGSWSIESGPDVNSLSLSNGELFTTELTQAGTYSLRYTLSAVDIPPLCDTYSEFNLTLQRPVQADIVPQIEVCNVYTGTLDNTVDLDDLIVTQNAGTWEDLSTQLSIDGNNQIDFTTVMPGTYSLRYTTDDAVAPCVDASFDTEITVIDCSCPDVSISPIDDMCIEVTDLDLSNYQVTSEAGEWSISAGTDLTSLSISGNLLNLTESTVQGEYTLRYTLSDPDIAPLCDSYSEVSFNLYEEPSANIISAGEACNENTGTLEDFIDLDDYNPGGASGVWTTSESGVSIDSDNRVEFISKEIKIYSFEFTTNTAVLPCVDQQYQVLIDLLDCSCPDISISPMSDLCLEEQSFDLNDLKITTEDGGWAIVAGPDIASVELIGSQLRIDEQTEPGIYSIEFSLSNTDIGPDCPLGNTVDFMVLSPPVADIESQFIACNEDTGAESTFVDLDDMNLSSSPGSWRSEDANLLIESDNTVSFEGVVPGTYEFVFTTSGAQSPCVESEYIFTANVKDCSCPSLVIAEPGDFCQDEVIFELNQLIIDADAGSWTMVAGLGSVPVVDDGRLVIDDETLPGNYELIYTLDNLNIPPDCESSTSVEFSIYEQPEAVIIDFAELCNNYIGSLPSEIDLDEYFVSGDDGEWIPADANLEVDSDNVVSFEGLQAGSYEIVYRTNTGIAPCEDVEYILTVELDDCVCPQLSLSPLPELCSDEGTMDLMPYLTAELEGEWAITPAASESFFDISPASELSISDQTPGGVYTISFTFSDGNLPSLCTNSVSVDFEIVNPPSIEVEPDFLACNADDSGFAPVSIDLDDFVTGAAGSWRSVDGSLIIDGDNVVSFEGVDADVYEFIYTSETAQLPCDDVASSLLVTVENCICPVIAFSSPEDFCNESSTIVLDEYLLNGVQAGTWTQLDGPQTVSINQAEVDADGVMAGEYVFAYTLSGNIPVGCPDSDQLSININPSVDVSVVPSVEVCNQFSSIADECIDLNDFVSGASGIWEAPSNFTGDFSDPSNVCFSGTNGGDIYVFRYTTNEAVEPCEEKFGDLEVRVRDCSCPNLELLSPPAFCNSDNFINLNDYKTNGTVNGEWEYVSGPELINVNNNLIEIEGVAAGDYVFQYNPDVTPASSCPQNNQLSISISSSASAGVGSYYEYCIGESSDLDLASALMNADLGGEWRDVSDELAPASAYDALNARLMIESLPSGLYEFEYSVMPDAPCESSSSVVSVMIYELPVADAGEDVVLDCSNTSQSIGGDQSSTGADISYEWINLTTGEVLAQQSSIISVETEGLYELVVTDNATQCIVSDQVMVTDNIQEIYFEAETEAFDCENPGEGAIMIFNQNGGDGNYLYSIDNGASWTEDSMFTGLDAGSYSVIMEDGNGCVHQLSDLVINAPVSLNVWAGDDAEIEYSEDLYPLMLMTDALDEEIVSIVWESDGEIICSGGVDDCYNIEVDVFEEATFCVTVTDINGCSDTDCVTIKELLEVKVYMANVFMPGSYSNNDMFFVQSNENVVAVQSFRIFDRWGGIVFEGREEHEPNNSDEGWDGTWLQRDVMPAVYTYHVVVVDRFGELHEFGGEVTLMR